MEFQTLFEKANGQPILYKGKELVQLDKINLSANTIALKITFLSTDSKYTQGIVLRTKGEFEIEGTRLSKMTVLWEDTAPKEVDIMVRSKDKMLYIYNAWKTEKCAFESWYNGAAIYIEEIDGAKIFHCNDGFPDDDFNDLVFKVEFL